MNPLLALLVIMIAFGVVGRIDYEVELLSAELRAEYAKQFTTHRTGVEP